MQSDHIALLSCRLFARGSQIVRGPLTVSTENVVTFKWLGQMVRTDMYTKRTPARVRELGEPRSHGQCLASTVTEITCNGHSSGNCSARHFAWKIIARTHLGNIAVRKSDQPDYRAHHIADKLANTVSESIHIFRVLDTHVRFTEIHQ